MITNLPYPKIMQPGQIKALDDYAVQNLRLPLFFDTADLGRPQTEGVRGRLYDVVTGLYIIFHDHGVRFLEKFSEFVNDTYGDNSLLNCLTTVKELRTGLCHGALRDGGNANDTMRVIHTLLPSFDRTVPWPGALPWLSDADCELLIAALTEKADEFFNSVRDYVDRISFNATALYDLKYQIYRRVLNSSQPAYGGRNYYFDERIVSDIARICPGYNRTVLYQSTVQTWVRNTNNAIRNNHFCANDMYRTLSSDLESLYAANASTSRTSSGSSQQSSASVFGI